MKRFLLCSFLAAAGLCAADLAAVHTVYLLPMSKGLDQYLANRLTNDGTFLVVTDPTKADAVLTDRIGEGFEQKMEEILPEPPQAAAPQPEPEPEKKSGAKAPEARGDVGPGSEPINKLAKAGSMSSFSRARGTVFLVSTKTRQVLWSAYHPPRDGSAKQLDRTAAALVARIRKDTGKQ